MGLEWMAWTAPTAAFFAVIALLLAGMTVWELRVPTTARRGLLPMTTTRGDRLFIGLVAGAFLNLAWIGLTDLSQWGALALTILLVALTLRYG
jgi:predicted small integral membrane protein